MPTDSSISRGFAPQNSKVIVSLIKAAAAVGIAHETVRDLLWLLNAPPDLSELSDVLANLSEILAIAESEWTGILECQGLDQLPALLRQLLPVVLRTPRSAEVGRDWVSRNSLYCALRCALSPTQAARPRYLLLQAHFFFAHSAYVRSQTRQADYATYGGTDEWPVLRISPYHAGLCIRHMAEQRHSAWASEFLDKLPVTLSPRELPLSSVVSMNATMPEFLVEKKVNYVSDYLCQVYDVKPRGHGHGSSPRFTWELSSEIGDLEDPSLNFGVLADWEAASQIIDVPVHPLVLSASTQVGEAIAPPPNPDAEPPDADGEDQNVENDEFPDENEAEEFVGTLDCENAQYEKSAGSFQGRVHSSSNQLIRQQKMFRFGIERLCGGELAGLGPTAPHRVDHLLTQVKKKDTRPNSPFRGAQSSLNKLEESEALLFLTVMLWTGSTPERVRSLFVHNSYRRRNLDDESGFAFIGAQNYSRGNFRISVPFPDYKSEQMVRPDLDRKSTRYVLLPDHINIALGINRLAQTKRYKGNFYLFQSSLKDYTTNTQILLRSWDPSGRLTLNKISSALFGRVMSMSGNDVVAATMITGNTHRLSKVPMYYACRTLGSIQEIYRQTVNDLLSEIGREDRTGLSSLWDLRWSDAQRIERTKGHDGAKLLDELEARNSIYIAARACPRTDAFRQAVLAIKASLRKPYRSSSDEAWIEFHQRYTFYSVWLFNIAVGSRKLITPYVDIKTVSPLNDVAIYRDKDGDGGKKAKLIWIPELVRIQMQHYADHLAYVRMRFGIVGEGLPCFFLNAVGRPSLVRPKSMFGYISEYLPGFAVDIHRRFVFNALLQSGCPPEVVRVWMGHACAGEEWWADNATYSHLKHREYLRQYLVPIIKDLEFEPIGGGVLEQIRQEAPLV